MIVFSHYPNDNRPRREAEALIEAGMSVDVICLRGDGESAREEINGVTAHRVNLGRKRGSKLRYFFEYGAFFAAAFFRLTLLHLRKRFDIVHVHNVPDILIITALFPRLTGARLILDIHDIMPEFYMTKYDVAESSLAIRFIKLLERVSAGLAHHMVIASPLMRDKIVSRSLAPSKCSTILNLPDGNYFTPKGSHCGSGSGAIKLVYPGTLSHVHGVDLAILAFDKARQRSDLPLELHIYGAGAPAYVEKLEALVQEGLLGDSVFFHDPAPVEDYTQMLGTMDIGLVPKRGGLFADMAMSTKLMEFGAVGLPAVVSRTPSDSLIFDDSMVAFFEPENVQDMAEAILRTSRDPDLRKRMSLSAREVLGRINWEREKRKLVSLYRQIQAEGCAPSLDEAVVFETLPTAPEYLHEYFRCPQKTGLADSPEEDLGNRPGFFRFENELICFGRTERGVVSAAPDRQLDNLSCRNGGAPSESPLPFDPVEVVHNLRLERYVSCQARPGFLEMATKNAYYLIRPTLPVTLRKYLQRVYLRGWDDLAFPRWPVDCTVDDLTERILALTMETLDLERVPIVWFWPRGFSAAALVTHDVETAAGRDFCATLIDINDSFDVQASFQVVPEKRYEVPGDYLEMIRQRGSEICIQGLNHDGRLFWEKEEFLKRADKINSYAREYGALGFRSPVLYRNQEWFDALEFSYDMSVPNVAHLDPQRGGCCTVKPYFVNGLLELPVTTIQDYSLFNILRSHSIDLWREQAKLIREKNGLMNFIVHPDYIIEQQPRDTYKALLEHLSELRSGNNVWIALPREVDRWWRTRSRLELSGDGNRWRIEGEGHERAQLAWAVRDGDAIRYQLAE